MPPATPGRRGPSEEPGSLSIVIPVFNGAATIGPLVERLVEQLRDHSSLEIILVNDGSSDSSSEVCRRLVDAHPDQVRFLDLSRNFGEHQAILAGLNRSSGDAVVVMDADLGLANVNVVLGIIPKYNLYHLIRQQKKMKDILLDTNYGIQIVAGASGFSRVSSSRM